MKSFKKYDFGMRISIGKISAAALLYIISTIRQKLYESSVPQTELLYEQRRLYESFRNRELLLAVFDKPNKDKMNRHI